MCLLDLCYEQTPGDPKTAYFLPTLFDDKGNKAADGERPLTWRELDIPEPTFVGRRLQCGDLERTFLTDGFFPRLQVVLHNHAFEMEWVHNRYSDTYKLEKNLFNIWVNGMEILIEFSGSSGYFVDILVKSSKSLQQIMQFLGANIIGTIRTFCADQKGCQGVTLVEAIIRPDCLYQGAGGNPILCTYRRDQYVLVAEFIEKMKSIPDYVHCWGKVEDGAGGLVLHNAQHLGTMLLEEVCFPSDNKKPAKIRGRALIVSMESERPGAGVERGSLKVLAWQCGFDPVQIYVDQTAFQLKNTIDKYIAESNIAEEDEAFMCSISGHGGTQDGQTYIVDETKAKVMVIRDIIDPLRRSKHLLGKPKIFFVSCCRGSNLYDNSSVKAANHDALDDLDDLEALDALSLDDQQGTGSLSDCLPMFLSVASFFTSCCRGTKLCDDSGLDDDDQQGTTPPRPHLEELSDCLIVFSTTEGCPSCRYPHTGTIFVEKLLEIVTKERQTTDVLSMMTMVNKRVTEVQNPYKNSIIGQCCEVRSFLREKVYWR